MTDGVNDSHGAGTEPSAADDRPGLAPGSVFAGLVVEEEVGRGGMGVIYRVRDPALDRVRALKVLPPDRARDVEFRERFQRESRQAAAIEHPGVTQVYSAGEEAGRLYLVMRYVDGPSLADFLAEHGRLPLEETLAVVRQVADALDAAHDEGLIHRDVKPANVLLEGEGPERRAFLCDFGISKLAEARTQLTDTGRFVGTVDYVAPEQLEGVAVDRGADIYSLACVAYHTLTGAPPFPRESQLATMYAHANAPRPVARAPGVPPAVGRVLARALAVRSPERHGSAGELAAELDRVSAGASVAPTRSLERPRARRRIAAGLAIGICAVAIAAAVLVLDNNADEAPGVVEASVVPVPSEPLAITAGRDRVWVASPRSDRIASIVPGEPEVEREVEVGGRPAGLAVGFHSVWVANEGVDELIQVQPATGDVLARVDVGDGPVDVAVSQESVWVANSRSDTVTRIGPTGPTGRPINVPDQPVAVAASGDLVWVVSQGSDSVVAVDAAAGTVLGRPIDQVGELPNDVATGEGAVWVTDNLGGTVLRVDPDTREVTDQIEVGARPRAVAAGLGFIWVANGQDGTVTRIDPERREAVGEPIPVGADPVDLAVGRGSVWVASFGDSTVTELRPTGQ